MIVINRTAFLNKMNETELLKGQAFTSEDGGHQFVITCRRDGEDVALSGTVTGRFMRADGVSVQLTPSYAGITSDGKAWVMLPANCYTVRGQFALVIFHTDGDGHKCCIYSAAGYVRDGVSEQIVDPENVIDVDAIQAMIGELQEAIEDAQEQATSSVQFTAQSLTDAQKGQARTNIGAGSEADVSDLKSAINNSIADIVRIDYPALTAGALSPDDGTSIISGDYKYTQDYIDAVTPYIDFGGIQGTVLCYDSNKTYLRYTLPMMQGTKSRAYLGPDVAFVRFNFASAIVTDSCKIHWTKYIFDFDYVMVDYYFSQTGQKTDGKAKRYVFDDIFLNVPFYGWGGVYTATKKQIVIGAGTDTVAYSQRVTGEYDLTIPYTLNSGLLLPCRFGKPFKSISVCCYGTSITNTSSEGKYPLALQGLLGQSSLTVKGVSGGKYINEIKSTILNDTGTYDIIILEGCANDWWYSSSIADMRTAIGAIAESVSARGGYIFYVTDHALRSYSTIEGGADKVINGYTSREYYQKCSELFAAYGIPTIDAGADSGINQFRSGYYVDQIHQSVAGGYVFAKAIVRGLISYGVMDALGVGEDNFMFDISPNPTKIF